MSRANRVKTRVNAPMLRAHPGYDGPAKEKAAGGAAAS
jgi:hypothetical protein